jgi:hypothetical protein
MFDRRVSIFEIMMLDTADRFGFGLILRLTEFRRCRLPSSRGALVVRPHCSRIAFACAD